MSESEEHAAKAQLLLDRNDARQQLALLEERAHTYSREFSALGALLHPDKIWNISLESYGGMLSKEVHEELTKLKSDISKGRAEVTRLTKSVRDAGLL